MKESVFALGNSFRYWLVPEFDMLFEQTKLIEEVQISIIMIWTAKYF